MDPEAKASGEHLTYCKAYPLQRLQEFDDWSELVDPHAESADDMVVYLQEDHTVTVEAGGGDLLVAAPSDAWITFCREQLGFQVPVDLRSGIAAP